MSPSSGTVLAFMAHPDDAEILCGGTLIRLARLGWSVHVATASVGDCGSVDRGPDEIAAVRAKEAQAGAAALGGAHHSLGGRDLRIVYAEPWISRAIDLFRKLNPTLVITHPRHDYMLDHEQVHLLARAASFGFAVPNASSQPTPAGAHIPHLYYADPIESRDPYTGQEVEPTTLVDISNVIEDKSNALACHASQRQWLRAHHGMDEYLDAMRRHGRERGRLAGAAYAEAFVQHRGHAYPQNDLLRELMTGKERT